MTFDEPRMWGYVEESQDLHSTATRLTRQALDEIVEVGRERRARGGAEPADPDRRGFLRHSLLAAGVIGGGALGASLFSRITVAGAASMDVQMLQTAASLENLAVAVYTRAASLPPGTSGASIPTVAPVEAQHAAVLRAVGALLAARLPQIVVLGPPASRLPAAAGSVGFPDTFFRTDSARPAAEGAVAG